MLDTCTSRDGPVPAQGTITAAMSKAAFISAAAHDEFPFSSAVFLHGMLVPTQLYPLRPATTNASSAAGPALFMA